MKLLDAYEMYHGGFIWDYIDQAIFVEDEVTGRKVLRYGGDLMTGLPIIVFPETVLYLQTGQKNRRCRR